MPKAKNAVKHVPSKSKKMVDGKKKSSSSAIKSKPKGGKLEKAANKGKMVKSE
jgi:hypothetical protein